MSGETGPAAPVLILGIWWARCEVARFQKKSPYRTRVGEAGLGGGPRPDFLAGRKKAEVLFLCPIIIIVLILLQIKLFVKPFLFLFQFIPIKILINAITMRINQYKLVGSVKICVETNKRTTNQIKIFNIIIKFFMFLSPFLFLIILYHQADQLSSTFPKIFYIFFCAFF